MEMNDKLINEDRSREQWIELRTQTERIEGVVHMPASSKGRRIADFLLESDRGHCGMLHLAHATVYDINTGAIKFRKRNLAVNKAMVMFASPSSASENLPKGGLKTPLVGMNAN